MSFPAMWMDLEIIINEEKSEKDKYHILLLNVEYKR